MLPAPPRLRALSPADPLPDLEVLRGTVTPSRRVTAYASGGHRFAWIAPLAFLAFSIRRKEVPR